MWLVRSFTGISILDMIIMFDIDFYMTQRISISYRFLDEATCTLTNDPAILHLFSILPKIKLKSIDLF